jgi:phosphoribosylformylglycinamidine synthase
VALAVAEMCLAGRVGASIDLEDLPGKQLAHETALFSESLSRFVIEVELINAVKLEHILEGVPFARIGRVEGQELSITKGIRELVRVGVDRLEAAWRGF